MWIVVTGIMYLTLYTFVKKSLDSEPASLTSPVKIFTILVCSVIKSSLNLVGRMPLAGIDRSATLLAPFARLLRNKQLLLIGGRSRVGVALEYLSALLVGAGTEAGEDVDVNMTDDVADEDDAGMIAP